MVIFVSLATKSPYLRLSAYQSISHTRVWQEQTGYQRQGQEEIPVCIHSVTLIAFKNQKKEQNILCLSTLIFARTTVTKQKFQILSLLPVPCWADRSCLTPTCVRHRKIVVSNHSKLTPKERWSLFPPISISHSPFPAFYNIPAGIEPLSTAYLL